MTVRIQSLDGTLFDGPADALIVPADGGLVGVRPGHAPMLVSLRPGAVRVTAGGREHVFDVRDGFADVSGDEVTIGCLDARRRAEQPAEAPVQAPAREAGP